MAFRGKSAIRAQTFAAGSLQGEGRLCLIQKNPPGLPSKPHHCFSPFFVWQPNNGNVLNRFTLEKDPLDVTGVDIESPVMMRSFERPTTEI